MGVYWPFRKISVTLLSRDSHVTKISNLNSGRTIAARANWSHTYKTLSDFAFMEPFEKKIGHVIIMWQSRDQNLKLEYRENHSR